MHLLTSKEVAQRLGVSIRRVQQLAEARRLPSQVFGGTLVFQEADLALVSDRKPGRPKKFDERELAPTDSETAKAKRKGKDTAVKAQAKNRTAKKGAQR